MFTMPSTKGLSHLTVDLSDGYDVKGVQISGRALKIICARIPTEEFTLKRVLNDCLSYGIAHRDNKKLTHEWAKEDKHKISQEYGRMGRREANVGSQEMWESIQQEANKIWKIDYSLLISQVAEKIAAGMENLPAEDRRTVRTIRGRIKKPKKI